MKLIYIIKIVKNNFHLIIEIACKKMNLINGNINGIKN